MKKNIVTLGIIGLVVIGVCAGVLYTNHHVSAYAIFGSGGVGDTDNETVDDGESNEENATITTNTNSVPSGKCSTIVGININGTTSTSALSGFSYKVIKYKKTGYYKKSTTKAWNADNSDSWIFSTCSYAGRPLTYSFIPVSIPSGYYLKEKPTITDGRTCSTGINNGCSGGNTTSYSCNTGAGFQPAAMLTKKLEPTGSYCIKKFNFSLCSYATVSVNITAGAGHGSWQVDGPFNSDPNNTGGTFGLPFSSAGWAGSGSASNSYARFGTYTITLTPSSGYDAYVNGVLTTSSSTAISCLSGQSKTFNISFAAKSCSASGACATSSDGTVCTSYSTSSSTSACSDFKIDSTCNAGTWSLTPGSYSSCSQYCAASGGCSLSASSTVCTSYSRSSAQGPSTSCSSSAKTSTCTINGTWSSTPYTYSSCSQICSTGLTSASSTTITAQNSTRIYPPSSWSNGSFTSGSTTILTIAKVSNISTGTGKFAGSTTVAGTGWNDPYGATNCSLSSTTITVLGTYTIDPLIALSTVTTTAQMHGYYDADGTGTATGTLTVTSGPTWSSSNTGVATISSSGFVTALSVGTTTISSTYQGVTATGIVAVTDGRSCSISASPNPTNSTSSSLSWSSVGVSSCAWTSGLSGSASTSGSQTVSVTGTTTYALTCTSTGTTTPITGSTTLGVSCPTGPSVLASLQELTMPDSPTTNLSAPSGWSSGTFSSASSSIISVAGSVGTAQHIGTTTISGSGWTAPNGAANCSLGGVAIVVDALCPAGSVSSTKTVLNAGETTNLSAPSGWSSGTFSSSNSSIVSILGSVGTAGSSYGTSSITGENWTAPSGATGCALSAKTLTVYAPRVIVSPSHVYVGVGKTALFASEYSQTGGGEDKVSFQANWSSASSTIASSNGLGSFTALRAGDATISAASSTLVGNATLTAVQCKYRTITVKAVNALGNPIANTPISLSSSVGTVTPSTGITSAGGEFTATLRAPVVSNISEVTMFTPTITAIIGSGDKAVVLTSTTSFASTDLCVPTQVSQTSTNGASSLFASVLDSLRFIGTPFQSLLVKPIVSNFIH